ncbi:MAG: hypothetical protein EOM03_09940 [Clostridia bacterium]|nr:hypothetical protein [Clostridia bacterium]NLF20417.1 hypothetical protein [Clostridiaceae bacterium]
MKASRFRTPGRLDALSRRGGAVWTLPDWLGLDFLLVVLAILVFYIWWPSRGYFHADNTDTILWAQSSLEAGRVFNPDFHYAALLPFGANLWYVPLVAVGGLTMNVQLAGMTVFLLVITLSLLYFFRSLAWRFGESFFAVALSLLLFSGSNKLREIFWGHVIYYSLGIVILSLGLGLLFRQRQAPHDDERKSKRWFRAVLLVLLSLGAATNGFQVMAVFAVPLLGALALEAFLGADREERRHLFRRNGVPAAQIFSGTALGVLLLVFLRRDGVNAGYAEAYTTWSASDTWQASFQKIVPDYLRLFGAENTSTIHLLSLDSLLLGLVLLTAWLVVIIPLLQLFHYKNIRSESTRLLLLTHAIQSFILLFLYVVGKLSGANWRLTPLLATSVISSLVVIRDWLRVPRSDEWFSRTDVDHRPEAWRFAIVFLAVIAGGALANAYAILKMPPDYGQNSQLYLDKNYILSNELEYGYATFWQANALTLLTDSQCLVRAVEVNAEKGSHLRDYQNMDSWYEVQPGVEEYFLLLTQAELADLRTSPDWLLLQSQLSKIEQVGQHIFVHFPEHLPELFE